MTEDVQVVWLRRDLRLEDNQALIGAAKHGPVLPVFIFDPQILQQFDTAPNDRRISFITEQLQSISQALQDFDSEIAVFYGKPVDVFKELHQAVPFTGLHRNRDYEPQAIKRDLLVRKEMESLEIEFFDYQDQVIFEGGQILTGQGKRYTVFTPFYKKWLKTLLSQGSVLDWAKRQKPIQKFVSVKKIPKQARCQNFNWAHTGYKLSPSQIADPKIPTATFIKNYVDQRDQLTGQTSDLSIHLRFGTISIRKLIAALPADSKFVSELVWREFYMNILEGWPDNINQPFNQKYRKYPWLKGKKAKALFQVWQKGQTGFPVVDAGMRQLAATGKMHNRVRMIAANFLTKLMRIDYRWGEHHFGQLLRDYDLAANNGNWQWSAGCGADAAPYFRIFNPQTQIEKFDPNREYIRHWVPEVDSSKYAEPVIDYKRAREQSLAIYKEHMDSLPSNP